MYFLRFGSWTHELFVTLVLVSLYHKHGGRISYEICTPFVICNYHRAVYICMKVAALMKKMGSTGTATFNNDVAMAKWSFLETNIINQTYF